MLTFEINHQESYSRGELLLRTFFGWLYIGIPHCFLLYFFGLILGLMAFISFFIILFTGVTPQWYYEWAVKVNRWNLRVGARLFNLADGYPEFWLEGKDDKTAYDLEFWQVSRGDVLVRFLLGWLYVGIPHVFILYFRLIGSILLAFAAFFVVLFTGKYPPDWHRFNAGSFRWANRVNLYMSWLYKDYPPFSGKPDPRPGGFDFEQKQS